MTECRACGRSIPPDGSLCPYCGEPVEPRPVSATETAPPEPTFDMRASALTSGSSTGSIDDARFTPGTMLTERYRIVGMLGKGGMGEVYRADDLTLRQPVALKFLPEALSKDTKRLERFLHEVRIARHVSHPNVCRVYDIAQLNGQQFISMEYVDGEDLAAVLRRLGRPSTEKALQIARQLCAGLAAAHEKGVLHRDLKPNNVMIDGQGKVRITDFGLAGFVEDLVDKDLHVGTPAYMAPEQLAGRGASIKSDIYSLGLVLYELFTGERAFEGTSRGEIARKQSEQSPTSLSSHIGDIDPVIERVILRCLEREPSERPSSALAVAAALPGGDPLAAALAAGETPDPAMVAAAGEVGGLRPAIAIPCLLGVAVLLVVYAILNNSVLLIRQVSTPLPPSVLAFRAAEARERLGYTKEPVDTAVGFYVPDDYLREISDNDPSPDRWSRLAADRPPTLLFWLRESPQYMSPLTGPRIGLEEPAFDQSGMTRMEVDGKGRLVYFEAVPPQRVDPPGDETVTPAPDWSLLFDLAAFDMASFAPTAPIWNPAVACDTRAAWIGTLSDEDATEVRIEAGAYRGRPNYLEVIYSWTQPWRSSEPQETAAERVSGYIFLTIVISVLVGSVWIAWRNLKLRRGDRSGAFRVSVVVLIASQLTWTLSAHHVGNPWREFWLFALATGQSLFWAGWLWLLYVAVEPYVRRSWPQMLISWTRLIAGRWRDPLVGRDLLAGTLLASLILVLENITHLSGSFFGSTIPMPEPWVPESLLSPRHVAAGLVEPRFVFLTLWYLFVLFLLKLLVRRKWIAGMLYVVLFSTPEALTLSARLSGSALYVAVLLQVIIGCLYLLVLTRFGLLAAMAAMCFNSIAYSFPFTIDFSVWYATPSMIGMVAILGIAAFGCHTALAGRPLFKDELLSG